MKKLGIYSIVVSLAVMLCTRISAQTAGVAANFGIDSTCYSGTPDTSTDDWFQGLSGDGVLDESNTAFYYNQLSTDQNIAFDVDLDVPKYSRPNGYILYDAKFIRDQIKLSGSNGDGTTFKGAKNGQNPEDWSPSGSGNVSGANDIVDGYIHMRRDGESIDDNLWMMMGITTLETNGDHFFDFEMYFSDLTFTGTEFINAGPDEGHNSWDFDSAGEIIQTGDLSVGFAVSGGGITNFEVRIWTSRWNYNNTTPAQFSWGTEFDGAKNNSIYGYASIVVSPADFFAVTNESATPAPPWGTHVAGAAFSTSYPANYFAEVAVNLSAIGLNNFLSLPGVNPCLSPFAKVMAKSRSSQSFTSALGDFTNPVEFSANSLIDSTGVEIADLYSCGEPSTLVPANPVIGAYYEWTTTDGLFENGTQTSIGDTAYAREPGTYTLSSAPLAECVRGTSTVVIDAHPCAVDDIDTLAHNSADNILSILNNDYDLDSDIDITSIDIVGLLAPVNGTVTTDPISGELIYTPTLDHIGLDSLEYRVCDVTGQCDTALVILTIFLDTDNDGIINIDDIDDDNDGITDIVENSIVIPDYQPSCETDPIYDFSTVPTLISGVDLEVGAMYRYPNVNPGVDAIVTIEDLVNLTIPVLDDNSTNPLWFNPQSAVTLDFAGDIGYQQYLFQFVVSGTTTPITLDVANLTFNDVDGNIDYGEISAAALPSSYTYDTPTELSFVTTDYITATAGTTEYTGVTGDNPQVNFYVKYSDVSDFRIRFGVEARIDGVMTAGRQHSLSFSCPDNFGNPLTTSKDIDEDGIPNSLDLDSDNDGIWDADEAGHGLPVGLDGRIAGADVGSGPNGLFDPLETALESGIENYLFSDSEAAPDGIFDPYELDSDGDTCFDTIEASVSDSEGDGIAGTGSAIVNADGLVISHTYITPSNNRWQDYDINSCDVCTTAIVNPHVMYFRRN